jgi:four helix bundle protein
MKINSYKDLIVWQKSMLLVELVYRATDSFPTKERFGIISQICRAAVSIPSNIAEGYGRRSHKEYLQFYSIAYGSCLELETQLMISKQLGYLENKEFEKIKSLLTEVIKMLYVMVYREKGRIVSSV